ncbi:hypothetical protein PVAND_000451 [Polypedilum vanderplanki]|uniref:Uncharacterized protein n=1 Tax=Polypedilum vanderplanki TaxID=319348 RepID=A0A9J6BK99_POLVA|nr:hypothetical protein PVAND_000451 [Polypedilum vanderplanki]
MITAHAAVNLTDINVNDLKDTFVSNLPEGITLPPEFNNIDIGENVNKLSDTFKQKCIDNSGSDAAFEEASQALTTLTECLQEIIDFSKLQEEIDNAKPHGNLDTVFNKYCDKRGNAIECVDQFTKSLDPCLAKEEKKQKAVFINMTKSLLEFTCHENGNQIALFIAEEGPECFESKKDQLIECANKTLGKYANMNAPTLETLPTLVIKEENCIDMDKLEECVVKELEQCKETTPANLVEALFRFVRKETPCKKKSPVKDNQKGVNASDHTKFSINVLLGTWIMAVFAKFLVSYQ